VGLGLAIVRRLVAAMGGHIDVRSVEGQGATFEFTVAVKTSAPSVAPPLPESPEPTPRRPARILIAEDDRINQLTLTLFLESLGYRSAVVDNGLEAVKAVRSELYDAVLMDIQMPVLDGIEATRRIRKEGAGKSDPHLPIIALTAHAMAGDREMFLAAGMSDYLSKPTEIETLGRVLHKALGAWEQRGRAS
jgi:CheY-like chemotaxis protein